jgi:23S rRNA pseudouridine1911/1915/1917 synthase
VQWIVETAEAGERLDRALAARLDLPRNQIQKWIRDGLVLLNGRETKPSVELTANDRVDYEPPERRDDRVQPEAGDLDILYEDADLVVLNKPAGLTVHPGAGRTTGTLAHHLLARYPEMEGVGGPGRPGIVHRLDQGTSGVLVVARTPAAHLRLARAFAERRVEKHYLAIVYGSPAPPSGLIDAPLGRHAQHRKEMTVRGDGRPARTAYRTLAAQAGISLLDLDLLTGRTHQIRVHMKHLGHPLVGDPVYGEARWKGLPRPVQPPLRDFPRPALHAQSLSFRHPTDDRPLRFEAPVPEDLRRLWEAVTGGAWPAITPAALA